MAEILVIGGGAAGMMAAVFAAKAGANVTLLEKNEKLGKKVYTKFEFVAGSYLSLSTIVRISLGSGSLQSE